MIKKINLIIISIIIGNSLYGQWVNRYNGQGDFSDKFNVVITDPSGNIYLAGSTINAVSKDLLVVKLASNGDTLWTNAYNGPGNGSDNALGMTIDGSGNIYVTGYQSGSGTGTDFITIKYNSSGVIQWTSSYNSVGSNQYDQGNSVAVDGNGNVFITGISDRDPTSITNYDYVTIKYNSNGTQQWAVQKNGTGDASDRPAKIAIDPTGNPVVTGYTNNGTNEDYLTIKYNGNSGVQMWAMLYDRTHNDRATGLAINPTNGNIYITGRSRNVDYDYATVCYNSAGVQQWAVIYDNVGDDRATELALDGSGNIYVTGQSDADASANVNYNITTIKYSTTGAQQWAKTYSGVSANDDIPSSLFVDAAGNSFVTGSTDTDPTATISNDYITLKYNTAGILQWSQSFSNSSASNDIPSCIAIDASGNVIVTGASEIIPQNNGATIKYNSSGVMQWTKYYNNIGDNSDNSHALAIDANKNIFVAGYSVGYTTERNFTLMKINSSGITQWVREINGTTTANINDDALDVVVDNTNNFIYVAGYTKNLGTSYDYTVAKYNQLGDTIWVRNYNGVNESDKAYAIALDANNNVYVTGKSDSDPGVNINDDILTLKYNSSGVLQWAKSYNGTGNGTDAAREITVTPSGDVYVSGKTFNGTNLDYVIIKYNSGGTQQWVKVYDGGTGDDECLSMVMDNSENTYLTGTSINDNGLKTDIATIKYNALGVQQWVQRYNGASGGDDIGRSIAIDNNGSVCVAGTIDTDTSASTLNSDVCTIKYNASGIQQWIKFFDGTAHAYDNASEIAVDNLNNIFVTCQADNGSLSIPNYDFVTLKYSSTGNQDTTLTYNGPGNDSDIPSTMIVNNNIVYVTGGSNGITSQRDIATIQYFIQPVSIKSFDLASGEINIYPNPFSDFTIVDLSAINGENYSVNITVTDMMGRLMLKSSNNNQRIIKIQKENMAAGIYMLDIFLDEKNSSHHKIIIQ